MSHSRDNVPYLDVYTELFKRKTKLVVYSYGNILSAITRNNDKVIYNYMTELNKMNIVEDSLMHEFTSNYYGLSANFMNETEIYDTFSGYYMDGKFSNQFPECHHGCPAAKKLDDRWVDIFIKKKNYGSLEYIIKNPDCLSEKALYSTWNFLLNEMELASKKYIKDFSYTASIIIKTEPPENINIDKIADLALKLFKFILNERNVFNQNIFDAISKRIQIFNKPEFIKAIKSISDNSEGKRYEEISKLYDELQKINNK